MGQVRRHATWEGDDSDLRRIHPQTGEVLESVVMPPGVNVSGLESDGGDQFFCGGGKSGKVRAYRGLDEAPRKAEVLRTGSLLRSRSLLAAYHVVSPASTRVLTVDPADHPSSEPGRARAQRREWKIASISLVVASAVLVIAVLVANLQLLRVALALLISLISSLFVFALLLAGVFRPCTGPNARQGLSLKTGSRNSTRWPTTSRKSSG